MQQRVFGASRQHLPIIGQGTWSMEHGRQQSVAALQRGIDLGMTHIDTAEMYGAGAVERVVGEAIRGRRDEVFLVSKVLPHHASARGTVQACEASLARLETDHLDLYLLHWPGSEPLGDTIAAFEQLVEQGKIRFWGVSNFDVDDLEHALALSEPGHMVCNQVLYHLGQRRIEHAVLPWCKAHDVAVVAYSPFGSGSFPSPRSAGGQTLAAVAAAHNASVRQIALAFLVRDAAVFTIPKASNSAHVEENAAAADLLLSADEVAQLSEVFPLGRPTQLPTL